MVKFLQSIVGLAVSVSLTMAAPEGHPLSLAMSRRSEGFSWENWAEDIIANPEEGAHLSPDEALEAFNTAVENGSLNEDPLAKRAVCDFKDQAAAKATVMCIDRLAAFGKNEQELSGPALGVPPKVICDQMSSEGHVRITGYTHKREGTMSVNQDVARGLGKIMDQCTRKVNGKNLVGGSGFAWGNGDFQLIVDP